MKWTNIYMASALLMAATACSNDENLNSNTDAVGINASITGGAASRSTDPDYTADNAQLTLYYGAVNSAQHSTFGYTDKAWNTTAPLYWQDLTPAATSPLYTFFTVAPAPLDDAAASAVSTDQSAVANGRTDYQSSDLLIGYNTVDKSAKLDVNLKHVLSQLHVTLGSVTDTDNALTAAELATATLKIDGLKTAYSLSYAAATAETPATVTATGDTKTGLTPYGAQNNGGWYFIAPNQTVATGDLKLAFTIKVGGTERHYTYTSTKALEMAAANSHTIAITVTRTGVSLGTITLTPWDTPAALTGEVVMDVKNNPITNAPEVTDFHLWRGANTETSKAGDFRDYSYTNGTWGVANNQTPFYIDDIKSTDKFFALHTPADTEKDAITKLKDLLGSDDNGASINGNALAMTFKHLMAKFTVILAKGDNLPSSVDLSKATIDFKSYYQDYTINGVTLSKGSAIGDYTGVTAANAAAGMIMVPQTIDKDATIAVIHAGGNTYTAKATADLKLNGAEHTILTITVSPTAVSMSTTVAAWTTATAAEAVTVGGIQTGTAGDNVGIPAGSLALQSGTLTATYSYNGSAWSTTAPLYWDSFTGTTTFYGLFTPMAAAAEGNEKDYLAGSASTAFGAPINLQMKHAMSQISITLKAGTGYAANPASPTDAENSALVANMTGSTLSLKGLGDINIGNSEATAQTGIVTLGNNKDIAFDNAATYIVAPQRLTDNADAKIVLTIKKGNTYTLKLSDITVDGNKLTKLEAGKSYILNVTVSEIEVSISATLTNWTSVSGSGTMTPEVH